MQIESISLTVQTFPVLLDTTTNCMACGTAKQKATIQTPIMNLTARDNLDIVCCLWMRIKKKQQKSKRIKENRQMAIRIESNKTIKTEKKKKRYVYQAVINSLSSLNLVDRNQRKRNRRKKNLKFNQPYDLCET